MNKILLINRVQASFLVSAIVGFALPRISWGLTNPDLETKTLLIEKLKTVQGNLAPNDPSKVSVTLRLADLLAEKARLESQAELDKGCQNCDAGLKDRLQALRFYSEVVDRSPENSRGKIKIQMGHLFQLTQQDKKAIEVYEGIIKQESDNKNIVSEAHFALGEMAFKRKDLAKAETHFSAVVKDPQSPMRGFASYRIGWILFNQNKIGLAVSRLKEILSTPELMKRSMAVGSGVDTQFQEEVSYDLATMMAKDQFNEAAIKELFKLSPEKTKIQNVQTLALEQERLGRKTEALTVWNFLYPYMNRPEDRMAAQLSMSQMQFDLGKRTEALKTYEQALLALKDDQKCSGAQCEELRKRARQFVVNWNQLEKKQPTEDLLVAYDLYSNAFPQDVDIYVYSSQVAESLKKYLVAWTKIQPGISHLKEIIINSKGSVGPLIESQRLKFENILVKQIELAEASKDEETHSKSLEIYLSQSLQKTKYWEVRYQQIKKQYDAGQYAAAAQAFREFALANSQAKTQENSTAKSQLAPLPATSLQKQAADLALDALVLAKEESSILTWAKEFAVQFPKSATEYQKIIQKSSLTQAAQLAGSDKALALQKLQEIDTQNAEFEDRVKILKNKTILAVDLKRFNDAQLSVDELLTMKNLSQEDTEFAWTQKAYLSELLLDFRSAMLAIENTHKLYKEDEKLLKLALFAELSGISSSEYSKKYLVISKDENNKQLVAAELVRKSLATEKNGAEKVLETYASILTKNPELYSQLVAEIYSKSFSEAILKKLVKNPLMAKTSAGKILVRIQFLDKFKAQLQKANQFKIDSTNDKMLAKSIKSWGGFIDQLEALAKEAIQESDWTSQLLSLQLLSRESERFYNELVSAPVPAGLNAQDEQQYLTLLNSQAAPYQSKAAAAKMKVEEFWKNSTWEVALKNSWKVESLQPLVKIEIDALKKMNPEKETQLMSIMERPQNTETHSMASSISDRAPTSTKVGETQLANQETPAPLTAVQIRQKIYKNPMDSLALEELLNIEKSHRNNSMVQYLENRIAQLKKEIQ